jgi:hypothetical protein
MFSPSTSAALSRPTKRLPMMKAWARPSGRACSAQLSDKPQLATVAREALEERQIVGRGEQQDVPDARQHQRRERVIHHPLVINRQQPFADSQHHRMQPCAAAAGQNNPFPCHSSKLARFEKRRQRNVFQRARCDYSDRRGSCGLRSGSGSRAPLRCSYGTCAVARSSRDAGPDKAAAFTCSAGRFTWTARPPGSRFRGCPDEAARWSRPARAPRVCTRPMNCAGL